MNEQSVISWFLILFSFGALGIAVMFISIYKNKFRELKNQVHAIHALIELIDVSLTDDRVTKEEFTALVKKCLSVLKELIP